MNNFYSDDIPDFFKTPKNYHLKSKALFTYPLCYAASHGKVNEVKKLIKLGVDIDTLGDLGKTPLHEAASAGYCEIVQILLDNGANTTICDELNQTPLGLAEIYGHQEIINLLKNIPPKLEPFGHGEILSLYENEEDFDKINISIDDTDLWGYFPLHIAVKRHSISEVEILLNAGADVNCLTRDVMAYSPLHLSIGQGDFFIMRHLLKNGADVNVVDGYGYSPMDIAMLIGDAKQIYYLYSFVRENSKLSRKD